jgi:hypothetical protein
MASFKGSILFETPPIMLVQNVWYRHLIFDQLVVTELQELFDED